MAVLSRLFDLVDLDQERVGSDNLRLPGVQFLRLIAKALELPLAGLWLKGVYPVLGCYKCCLGSDPGSAEIGCVAWGKPQQTLGRDKTQFYL